MSTIERPDGRALGDSARTPPPLIFSSPKPAHAMPARIASERKPLTQAAARHRTSWTRRFAAVIVLLVAMAGVALTIKESHITLGQGSPHVASAPNTLLSARELRLPHHRHARSGRHHGGAVHRS